MKKIRLTRGRFTAVDDKDYEALNRYKWFYHTTGYAMTWVRDRNGRRMIRMHRLILKITDPNIQIDHRDRDGLNNQRYNLRVSTQRENVFNTDKPKNNTSGFKGVSRKNGRWVSRISDKYKRKYLGIYDTPIEAAIRYDKEAKKLHGGFACLNFPEGSVCYENK